MKRYDPLVSFVIPTYNRVGFLDRAIESVLAQDCDAWELLLIDDGSTDETGDFIKKYSDDRIRYFKTENRERGAARNFGVSVSKGHYISFLDSDDLITKDALSQAAKVIDAHPDWFVFHFSFEIRSPEGVLLEGPAKIPSVTNPLLVRKNVIGCQGVFIKRDILIRNPFNERRDLSGSEDYELWVRLASRFTIYHLEPITAVLIQHVDRSMLKTDFHSVERRIMAFLDSSLSDEYVLDFLGRRVSEFKAFRYSYISLYAVILGRSRSAIRYLFMSVRKWPFIIFSFRFYVIIVKILTFRTFSVLSWFK